MTSWRARTRLPFIGFNSNTFAMKSNRKLSSNEQLIFVFHLTKSLLHNLPIIKYRTYCGGVISSYTLLRRQTNARTDRRDVCWLGMAVSKIEVQLLKFLFALHAENEMFSWLPTLLWAGGHFSGGSKFVHYLVKLLENSFRISINAFIHWWEANYI